MMSSPRNRWLSLSVMGASVRRVGLQRLDPDLRRYGPGGFSTAGAATQAVQARPQTDARGVITYPNYQVAVTQDGDTVATVATPCR